MASTKSAVKPVFKKPSSPMQSMRPTPKHKFKGHEMAIEDLIFLHDDVHIVSGSLDGTMHKWNCDTGLIVGKPWRGNGGSIWALALSPDGKTIACGRRNGSVQRWNTDGEMEGVWMGHSKAVRSLSWSSNGDRIASGSNDGKIIIRKAENGEVEVGPIETKQDEVFALAYSPSGSKIASGGWNHTICVWDSNTGELVVGPMKDLTNSAWSVVWSVVWSSDSSKLYSASNEFARVFDSVSGDLLHSFKHDNSLYSVALSPKSNVLACVGLEGVAQLWDTKSHKPLGGQPFGEEDRDIPVCVSFSRDGTHLAYGGTGKTITLWMVKDIAPELILQQGQGDTQAKSRTSLFLEADATRGDGITEDGHDNPYDNFFQSSEPSLLSAPPGPRLSHLFSARFWNVLIPSRHPLPSNNSASQEHNKRGFFARLAHSNHPIRTTTPTQHTQGEDDEGIDEPSCSVSACTNNRDTGINELPADVQISRPDAVPSVELDSTDKRNIWERMRARGKNSTSSVKTRPVEVVGVSAARGFKRIIAWKPKLKTKSPAVTSGTHATAVQASASSQAGPSSQVGPAQTGTSSQAVSGQPGLSLHTMAGHTGRYSQATGGPSSHASPSHITTTYHTHYTSDSRSTIEGSCMRFLDKICFPCGHYYNDS